jgi:hypothetical protein
MPGRAGACWPVDAGRSAMRVCGCGPSPGCDGAGTLGQGRTLPAAGHPFAQLWWAWSGAVATRGVNQEWRPRRWGSDMRATARGLRPERSRRPVSVQRADVSVAQPVVNQREQFACRGSPAALPTCRVTSRNRRRPRTRCLGAHTAREWGRGAIRLTSIGSRPGWGPCARPALRGRGFRGVNPCPAIDQT